VSLPQRLDALERAMGAAVERCPSCGTPGGNGVLLLYEGEQPGECSECGGVVDRARRGVEALLRSGATTVLKVVLHRGEAPR
jgi:hypothetical protein